LSIFNSVQISDAYVSTSLTTTLYINILDFLDIKCVFRGFPSPWKCQFAEDMFLDVNTDIIFVVDLWSQIWKSINSFKFIGANF
jgi:hypothetical protein